MRVVRLILSLLLILSSSPRLSSQQSTTPPQRDPQAIAVLQNSIAKMGGSAVVANVTDAVVTGSVAPISGSSATSGTFKWETAGAEYRYDFQLGATTQSFLSGHGQPANIRNGTVTKLSPLFALTNSQLHLPALVLADAAANNKYSVISGGNTIVNGTPATKVHIFYNADVLSAIVSAQDWYFDASTGIPLRVEHRLPDSRRPENYVLATEEFSDFRTVSRLLVPFKITSYEEGALVAVETVTAVNFNNGLSPTDFDVPAGGGQ